jgi:intracellular multiplication protein IcmO
MAVMFAQARSLGFSLVAAAQDIPAMLRENETEAKSIIANTTNKVFMRIEETEATAKLAVESAGKGWKTQVQRFEGRSGETQIHYADSLEATLQEVDRINPTDLRALGPGQCYITWRDRYFKVQTFYANPEGEYKKLPQLELRANHFIPVSRPNPSDIEAATTLPLIAEALADAAHAKELSDEAKAERTKIEAAAGRKTDPSTIRQEIPAVAVAINRAVVASSKGRAPTGTDYLQGACAAVAAVLLGAKRAGETFKTDVRATQGLGAPAARTAASAPGRMASEVPGMSAAAADAIAGQRRAPPPRVEDEEDAEFDEAAFGGGAEPGRRGAVAAALAEADAPSAMRPVEHGVSVDRDVFRMADDIARIDTTRSMLAALDFDNEQPVEETDAAIEEAVSVGEEGPPPPSEPPAIAEIERADRASAAATQWPDRAAPIEAPVAEVSLAEAVKRTDIHKATDAFLAGLLADDAIFINSKVRDNGVNE